jgi:hypothetical protein
MLHAMSAREDEPAWEAGHEPDEEYLALRERIGWQSVTVIAGTIVVLMVFLWIVLAVLAGGR